MMSRGRAAEVRTISAEVFRIALFGCGRIGRVHARSVGAHEQAELAWACDPEHSAAEAVASRWGARSSTSIDDALGDRSVDAVVVAAATPVHLELLSRSVRAGKPVLCEKPLDFDLGRTDQC